MKRDGVVNFIIRLIIKTMLFIQLFHNNRYIRFGDLSSMWWQITGMEFHFRSVVTYRSVKCC